MTTHLIEMRGIEKRFGAVQALQRVDLTLRPIATGGRQIASSARPGSGGAGSA